MTSAHIVNPDLMAVGPGEGLVALAQGRVERAEPELPPADRRRIPSLYADPIAWLVLDAIDAAIDRCPGAVLDAPDEVAVVLVSAHGTMATMAAIARAVPSGRLSPMRFAGASAGGAVSLACIVHGFRGPTLMFTTEPEVGYPAALIMARSWLRTEAARYVVLSVHEVGPAFGHSVTATVFGSSADLRSSLVHQ